MTTIAAFLDKEGKLVIAGDMAVTGGLQFRLSDGKIKQIGGITVGFAGIMPPRLRSKRYPATMSGVESFANDYHKALADLGHGAMTEDGVRVVPSDMICCVPGHPPAWVGMYNNILVPDTGYCAIGSGAEVAIGVLWVAKATDMAAEDAINLAMSAAAEHDPGTSQEHTMAILEKPVRKTRKKKE